MALTETVDGLGAPIDDLLGEEVESLAELEVDDPGILLVDRVERGRVTDRNPYLGSIASFGVSTGSERTSFVFVDEKGTKHLGVTLGERPIPGKEQSPSDRYYRRPRTVAPIGTLVTRFFRLGT